MKTNVSTGSNSFYEFKLNKEKFSHPEHILRFYLFTHTKLGALKVA
jgi:hypothetical protein